MRVESSFELMCSSGLEKLNESPGPERGSRMGRKGTSHLSVDDEPSTASLDQHETCQANYVNDL